ncbi:MAG: tRNA uridine(34) 5-carboxymethylaminomethyl modification radical SAM/GNAT enzyme Elp3 [Crenarchaeota archaeon]|nr:tRNA uridine(34) 5-carboxymethylaminomethyl modification radical SAM/GNAT enzyme Elp3 [Thermoproteota archaeon]
MHTRSTCKGLEAKKRIFRNIKKPVRTISGVVPIAVMTRPYPCPGRCIYCPGGLQISTPKSYMPDSPVVLRASPLNYDPYLQTAKRVKAYIEMGHRVSKVEIIVMGGSFTALPESYRIWFIGNIYKALNDYPVWSGSADNVDIEREMLRNEKAKIRVVVLNIETRPDLINERIVDELLYLGVTRVEMGVQTIYDDVLEKVKRGHTVREVIEATRMLKDSAYKVCYHIMPGLPGSDPDRDLEMVRTIFEDPVFRPDCVKIYPTLVIPGTELYEMWRRGEYRSYDMDTWIELLTKIMSIIPRWVRVMRFGRDIPLHWVVDGPRIGNLRQVILDELNRRGLSCMEIRCREAGHRMLERGELSRLDRIEIKKTVYEASGGVEVFLEAVDDEDTLYGILRLRIPSDRAHRREIRAGRSALVRELHVYGPQVPIEERRELACQHKGIGRMLLAEAEKIALDDFSCYRMFIISAVGVRDYYRRLGYRRYPGSFYMYKNLKKSMLC